MICLPAMSGAACATWLKSSLPSFLQTILAVSRVLKDAAHLLEGAGHDGSMNGYQSADPRRAYLLAGAIWSAVTGLALTYAEPPASFEEEGQKIRGTGSHHC